jgi:hypothetical protein
MLIYWMSVSVDGFIADRESTDAAISLGCGRRSASAVAPVSVLTVAAGPSVRLGH